METINPEWTAYNNAHNEGSEGYNPHDQYITTGGGEPLWSILDDKQYRLLRILTATSNDAPRYTELVAEIAELGEAIKIAKEECI